MNLTEEQREANFFLSQRTSQKYNQISKFCLILTALVLFFFSCARLESGVSKYFLLGTALFSIGIWGVIASKSILKTLISLELLLNAININLVVFSKYGTLFPINGQVFSLFVIAVAAAEAAIAISIAISVYSSLQLPPLIDLLKNLKEK